MPVCSAEELGRPESSETSQVAQSVKNLPAIQETQVRSPGWEDPLDNGNPLRYSCLGNPMDRGDWWATAHGVVKKSDMT